MPTSRVSHLTVATVTPTNKGGGSATSLAEATFLRLMGELEPELREAVRAAFFDVPGRFEAFISVPSSLSGHHNFPGGNLVHTVDVAEKALALAGQRRHIDRHVLLASCLLHDIGKCEEYVQAAGRMRTSDTGRLLGHKLTGFLMSSRALQPLMATSQRRALAVLNAISCTASRSYDFRGPGTLEAFVLSRADQISATSDLFEQSWRASGGRFHGVAHPHLKEPPKHPCALASSVACPPAPPQTAWISARAKRYAA